MIRKMLLTAALAAGIATQADAARYITVSVQAGFHFTATFDMTATDPFGAVYAYGPTLDADIYDHDFQVMGWTGDFVDYYLDIDLAGYDLSPSEFSYHDASPNGSWFADFTYYIDQYEFLGSTGGPAFNLQITGTDRPQTVGLQVNGDLASPSVLPEPTSWALTIGGFGLVGGAMRTRRKTAINFA